MTDEAKQLDPLEDALLELEAAEKTRLFHRTRIDSSGLLTSAIPGNHWESGRLALRLLPVAAAVAMAVGAGAWMFRQGINSTGSRETTIISLASAGYGSFHSCLTGPTDGVPPECLTHDYDSDGDVDLADFRAFQVASLRPAQTR